MELPIVTYDELQDKTQEVAPLVTFSNFETKEWNASGQWLVYDNLDEVAIHGEVVVEDADGSDLSIRTDPTWLDLCRDAQTIIEQKREAGCGGYDDVFFEDYIARFETETPRIHLVFGS
jgi:hypothetical protein